MRQYQICYNLLGVRARLYAVLCKYRGRCKIFPIRIACIYVLYVCSLSSGFKWTSQTYYLKIDNKLLLLAHSKEEKCQRNRNNCTFLSFTKGNPTNTYTHTHKAEAEWKLFLIQFIELSMNKWLFWSFYATTSKGKVTPNSFDFVCCWFRNVFFFIYFFLSVDNAFMRNNLFIA